MNNLFPWRWLSHYFWDMAVLVTLCLSLSDSHNHQTECAIGDVYQYTEWMGEEGRLRIPEKTFTTKKGTTCPEELNSLPISHCEYLDDEYSKGYHKNGYWLELKTLVDGFPGKQMANLSVLAMQIDQGGLESLDENMFLNTSDITILSMKRHWLNKIHNIDCIFSGLTYLTELHLDNNGITSWDISGSYLCNYQEFCGSKKTFKSVILPNLVLLSLSGNPIEHLDESSFIWLSGTKLKYLKLRDCTSLMMIAAETMLPIHNTLQFLDLAHSGMSMHLLKNLTKGLKCMKSSESNLLGLGLAQMGLREVPHDVLCYLKVSLKYLSLYGNYLNFWQYRIQAVDNSCYIAGSEDHTSVYRLPVGRNFPAVFPALPHLLELDLRHINVISLPHNMLQAIPNIEKLLLGDNIISYLDEYLFYPAHKLTFLSLSRQNEKLNLNNSVFRLLTTLETLDLSYTALESLPSNVFRGLKSLKRLSLCYTGLTTLPRNIFSGHENLEILDVSGNRLSSVTFQGLVELRQLYASDCELNLHSMSLKQLHKLEFLDLHANNIQQLESHLFSKLPSLHELHLSNNRITAWQDSFFQNSKIKILLLQQNLINEVTPAMLEDFQQLSVLDISDNPFICYCSLRNFSKLANSPNVLRHDLPLLTFTPFDNNTKVNISDHTIDYNLHLVAIENLKNIVQSVERSSQFHLNIINWPDSYICQGQLGKKILMNLEQVTEDNCVKHEYVTEFNADVSELKPSSTKEVSPVIYIGFGAVAVITALTALCYWKRWHIRTSVCMLYNTALLSVMKKEQTQANNEQMEYKYDVFVSYSDSDRQWVLDHLLPNLETTDYKVCLHERDFQAGLSILENIIACMEQSHCILLIVSEAFMRSHWCQFELNMAQHQLLEMRRDRLVLVLLEQIPREKRTKMIRYLMLTKTYLEWSSHNSDRNSEQYQVFWRRLRKAVGPIKDINISLA